MAREIVSKPDGVDQSGFAPGVELSDELSDDLDDGELDWVLAGDDDSIGCPDDVKTVEDVWRLNELGLYRLQHCRDHPAHALVAAAKAAGWQGPNRD